MASSDMDPYGPARPGRTFILAYSAADAKIFIDIRLVDDVAIHFIFYELYGFFGDRTVLLANYTLRVVGPGNAGRSIYFCGSEFRFLFFLKRQFRDCAGRADLSAKGTVVLAVAYFRQKLRRPHAFKPGLERDRLQAVCYADFHAVSASYAPVQKFFFVENTRGSDDICFGCAFSSSIPEAKKEKGREQ